jgi:hypothetical protein
MNNTTATKAEMHALVDAYLVARTAYYIALATQDDCSVEMAAYKAASNAYDVAEATYVAA